MASSLHWCTVKGQAVAIAYHSFAQKIIPEITDYSIYLSDTERLHPTTVKNEIQYIHSFLAYMRNTRKVLEKTDDEVLIKFRDRELNEVKTNAISRGNERTAKRTVNAKLRRIYRFLWWYQDTKLDHNHLIGPTGCRVTADFMHTLIWSKLRSARTSSNQFPTCFKRTGSSSRHRVQDVPTIAGVDRLRKVIAGEELGFVSIRNLLFLSLAEETGMRRGAINSLRISQFSEARLEEAKGDFLNVVPDDQKFSYQSVSEVPLPLAFQVLNYAEAYLKPIYSDRGWNIKFGEDRLFVSERNGRPLQPRTFSRIFGQAFKSIDKGKGRAVHILRHHFTDRAIVEEVQVRLEAGMDTSLTSVCAAVSLKLGHAHPDSIKAYVSSVLSKILKELCEKAQRARSTQSNQN